MKVPCGRVEETRGEVRSEMRSGVKKPFQLALLVGRFQMLHAGHEEIVRKAVESSEEVGILIGSSQEAGTEKNPFSYDLRVELLRKVFGDEVKIAPLPDIHIGNVPAWGEYVLDEAERAFGRLPDLVVSGKEDRRMSWFAGTRGAGIAELTIPKTVEISASELREALLSGDRAFFIKQTNPALHPEFDRLRRLVIAAQGHNETESI